MQQEYKELLITDDMNIARSAKKQGRYVVLCHPLSNELPMDNFGDYPYAIERMAEQVGDGTIISEEFDTNYLDHILCRMKGIPCEILDTQRCHVREITVSDVDALYEIYKAPEITEFMEDLYEKKEDEIAYTQDYIKYQYGFYDYGMWIVESLETTPDNADLTKDNGTRRIIGRAGFDMREGYDVPELGFMIRKEDQHQGYATEICEALLAYGKEQLGFLKVGAFTDSRNTASIRLLEKLGFRYQRTESVKTVKCDSEKLDYYLKCL